MNKWAWLLVLVVFFTLGSAALAFDPIPADDLKIGFVFVGPVGDGGWSYMHDQGRQAIEKAFPGVTTMYAESVPEGPDCARVMEQFVRNGAKLVFATSFGYMDQVIEVAKNIRMLYSCIVRDIKWPTMSVSILEECIKRDIYRGWWREV